ncbi:hypothetical protein CHLRE_15g642702v5 [Chlamydomonas reinhardtii]|uniref:Uncharacterized protein n=1 Tax=Chlamydomonas reinhardtii TaxID=3055 RepID=A0A2K3CWX7_CHLRE|nr:uncharacterized protein CHLRE_15g642702v5 [Chlamydomonas reinhardtii]PNW72786.1 hypothetical protein CHLRE_15g642702v5 [Chlamydomonas reinhardtii]
MPTRRTMPPEPADRPKRFYECLDTERRWAGGRASSPVRRSFWKFAEHRSQTRSPDRSAPR